MGRLRARARRHDRAPGVPAGIEVAVHVIEPGTPGSGVYDVAQPDYLLLNNPCGQLSLYPFETRGDRPRYGVGLYEWAVARGYRWVGDRCAIDATASRSSPITSCRGASWASTSIGSTALVARRRPASTYRPPPHRPRSTWSRRREAASRCTWPTAKRVDVDHVIVTSGHTANRTIPRCDPHPRPRALIRSGPTSTGCPTARRSPWRAWGWWRSTSSSR